MKRIPRDPKKFGAIDLVSSIGSSTTFKIGDAASEERILDGLRESYVRAAGNEALLHGRRTEGMFGYVAAALGKCALVKEEDAGEVYAASTTLRVPDYRVVTDDGYECLVEVKNFLQAKGTEPFTIKTGYLRGLEEYGNLFAVDVMLAVYWPRWNAWTLVPVERLTATAEGDRVELSFADAMKMNEMSRRLGDQLIGTTPPLTLRLVADANQPREVPEESGSFVFTIGGVEMYCAGKQIADADERSLALQLMLHGQWHEKPVRAEIMDGKLVWIDFEFEPLEPAKGQNFEIVASLSSVASARYDTLTLSDAGVARLRPQAEPDAVALKVLPGFQGKDLPLWWMRWQPADEEE